MEQRGQKHHRERLSEALREEISALIEGELGDPRIGLATVSEVRLSPDGRAAHVLISLEGGEEEAVQTLNGLHAATGYIRRELTTRLRLRHAPDLFFELDKSQQYGSRIDELLKRIEKRSK